jgi:hypothetical protein
LRMERSGGDEGAIRAQVVLPVNATARHPARRHDGK